MGDCGLGPDELQGVGHHLVLLCWLRWPDVLSLLRIDDSLPRWRQQRQLLKLRVWTALRDVIAAREAAYGHLERATDGRATPGQSWTDLDGVAPQGSRAGLSVLNDCKLGFDVLGGRLGITATRSPV